MAKKKTARKPLAKPKARSKPIRKKAVVRKSKAKKSASKKPAPKKFKVTRKTKNVFSKSQNRNFKINKRHVKVTRAFQVNELNAVEKIEKRLGSQIRKQFDSLKKSKKKISLVSTRLEFKGKWRDKTGKLTTVKLGGFSVGLAKLRNKKDFDKQFKRTIATLEKELAKYFEKGFESLSITGAEIDGYEE